MRRAILLLAVMGLGLLLVSGVALAKTFTCRDNPCVGTNGADLITGTFRPETIQARSGDDEVRAREGRDVVIAGSGNDLVYGGPGNDRIYLVDGEVDWVNCGPGIDTLVFDDGLDRAAPGTNPNTGNCENLDPR